jgi:hypothetical protein
MGQAPAAGDGDVGQPQPAGHQPQLRRQRAGDVLGVGVRFQMSALHPKHAGGAVGLEVTAGGDLFALRKGRT